MQEDWAEADVAKNCLPSGRQFEDKGEISAWRTEAHAALLSGRIFESGKPESLAVQGFPASGINLTSNLTAKAAL